MHTLPLRFHNGHLFIESGNGSWLIDTGAPTSFGASGTMLLAGEKFSLATDYLGLTADTLSQFVGAMCVGLVGVDILGGFDHVFDVARGILTVSKDELTHGGHVVRLEEFMGIPILSARIGGGAYRMFFDTGAQISYFQDDSLGSYPAAGSIADFFPGVGQFQTDTHEVQVSLAEVTFTLRCGMLPGLLAATLMMADAEGIVGNQILLDRTVGYFPRRRMLSL